MHAKEQVTKAALVLVVFLSLIIARGAKADEPYAQDPRQPNPDVFTCCVQYNKAMVDLMDTGVWRWNFLIDDGCNDAGDMVHQAFLAALNEISASKGIYMVYDPILGHKNTVSCGSKFIATCGSLTGVAACLNGSPGYPVNVDITTNSIVSTYYFESIVSIMLHELMHAMGTWNEQYCYTGACASTITCVANWYDFMNCGPDSRHRFDMIENYRYARVFGSAPLQNYGIGWNPGGYFVYVCGSPLDDFSKTNRIAVMYLNADGSYVWSGIHLAVPARGQCVSSYIDAQVGRRTCVNPENKVNWIWGRNDVCM